MTPYQKYLEVVKKSGNFVSFPTHCRVGVVINGLTIEARHRLLIMTLMSYDSCGTSFKVGIRDIKKALGMGSDTILTTIKDLEKAGLLKVTKQIKSSNEYNLGGFYNTNFNEYQKLPVCF